MGRCPAAPDRTWREVDARLSHHSNVPSSWAASNQLGALLEIMRELNLPVQAALAELRALPEKLNDPNYLHALRTPGSLYRAKYPEFMALVDAG